jgi:large subunit ribosomal protein L24
MKVKKNDLVEVIAGKDKGARGKVIAAYPRTGAVLVEGVNRVTKHTKVQTSRRGSRTGGIVHQEAPIDVSNVMVLDPDGVPTRVGYRIDEQTGAKVRYARKTGKELP